MREPPISDNALLPDCHSAQEALLRAHAVLAGERGVAPRPGIPPNPNHSPC
jgi:hypothetical protein